MIAGADLSFTVSFCPSNRGQIVRILNLSFHLRHFVEEFL